MRRHLRLIAAAALTVVTACTEDEQACYDRISADLIESADFGRSSGDLGYATTATDSGYVALAIFVDEGRSICDYVAVGPRLQRK